MCQFESMSLSEKETPENREAIPANESTEFQEAGLSNAGEEAGHQDELPEHFTDHASNHQEDEGAHDGGSHEEGAHDEGSHEEGVHKEKGHRQAFEAFLSELNLLTDPEAKLQRAIAFMESSLSQGGTPHFKSFWEARNLSLELFKQNINPSTRNSLWIKYSELSKEARRLREILEEQSVFAAEQIEIAIQALENDVSKNEESLQKSPEIEFPMKSKALEPKLSYYQSIQRELNLLNAQASRINALRKELIKTEMRIRTKNKFFQRLSCIGDKVFPRRKELIKDISQHFIDDVDSFIKDNFSKEGMNDSLFYLREEIKSLQGIAKFLTLNTHSFTQTRVRLSDCWDKIKVEEKERKKVRSQQKAVFKQNYDEVYQQIQNFNQAFVAGELSNAEANKKIDEIVAFMRRTELGRDELKSLRDALSEARKPLLDKVKSEEQERQNLEDERERQKKKRLHELAHEVDHLLRSADAYDADRLYEERNALLEKITVAPLTKLEKQDLEKSLKPLRDTIAEKKEKALLSLSEDDRQSLQKLKDLLKEKKERRQEIKNQLETYRKAKGSSGMDFEQAMSYNSQMAAEKERLDKINGGIKEIEQKIEELENKL